MNKVSPDVLYKRIMLLLPASKVVMKKKTSRELLKKTLTLKRHVKFLSYLYSLEVSLGTELMMLPVERPCLNNIFMVKFEFRIFDYLVF